MSLAQRRFPPFPVVGTPSSLSAGTKTEQDTLGQLPWAASVPALLPPPALFPPLHSLPHLCQHGQNKQVELMDSMMQPYAGTSEPAVTLQCSPCFQDSMEQALVDRVLYSCAFVFILNMMDPSEMCLWESHVCCAG